MKTACFCLENFTEASVSLSLYIYIYECEKCYCVIDVLLSIYILKAMRCVYCFHCLPHLSDPHLPLSSLRLLVPPLRLMSACMWQVAQERNVDQYDKLAEFITLVTEMVPELLNYKQRTQLILGLRALVSDCGY